MLQSMVQNVSDEEDDTWGKWTAQGNSQQAPSQAPTTCLRRVELDSRERSNRIARRVQVFLDSGYKCFSQARCLADSTMDNHNWLQQSELDKIKAESKLDKIKAEQKVSDEEDDTWKKWTAQGNSQWASTTSAATEHNTHHTHLAAVILDAAIERTASSSYTAVRTKAWFNNLKQDVIDVTFVPLTRCALARRSARPPKKKQRKGGIWPTSIESISRCVAAYHRAANGAEHDECDRIVDKIGAYAHTLCTRNRCPDQLLKLLHQWIENRSINMALRLSLERCLAERTCWKHVTDEERAQAVHLMKTAMEIVQMNGERLHRCMDNLRSTVN